MELHQQADSDTQVPLSDLTCSSSAVGNTLRLRTKSLFLENAPTDQRKLKKEKKHSMKARWTTNNRWVRINTDKNRQNMVTNKNSKSNIRTANKKKSSEMLQIE